MVADVPLPANGWGLNRRAEMPVRILRQIKPQNNPHIEAKQLCDVCGYRKFVPGMFLDKDGQWKCLRHRDKEPEDA